MSDSLANTAPTASPETLAFDRFEFKYWITERQKAPLVDYIRHFMDADAHNDGDSGYHIQSLYFDTTDLRAYYEKYDGDNLRSKYRIRFYQKRLDKAFFELKQKRNIFVHKRRAAIDLRLRETDGIPRDVFDAPPPEVEFFVTGIARRGLRPCCWVSYRRLAFTGHNNPNLRLTLDYGLSGAPANELKFPGNRTQSVYFSNWDRPVILEIKFSKHMPTWLEKAIRDLGIINKPISKYGIVVNKDLFFYMDERRWTH